MANLINLNAESGANMIGDDAVATLTLDNSSTGADIALNIVESTSATDGVRVRQGVVGNMSIGVLKIVGNSVASGAMLEFSNKGFISITSVVLTTVANTDYAIRVQVGAETRWIPCFKDAAMIGSAAF